MWAPDGPVVLREEVVAVMPDRGCRRCGGSGTLVTIVSSWNPVGDYGQGFWADDTLEHDCACLRVIVEPVPVPQVAEGEVPF